MPRAFARCCCHRRLRRRLRPDAVVLDRGGINQRIRGIVLLDALYPIQIADWIAANRSAFS